MTAIRQSLASVIVPCRAQLEFTRLCVDALLPHTSDPWELVAVDDGSADDTAAYLAGLRESCRVPVAVVTHADPCGFPVACNAVLAAARGQYLVLLNNDAVVTDGWLDQHIALVEADPKIAMTGPMSNYASPPQFVPNVPYRNLDEMHRFADEWRRQHLGQWFTCEELSGFCPLIKRTVFKQLSVPHERFDTGLFDDTEICLRARKAGYELAVAFDCFVHHGGGRTIASIGIDADASPRANSTRFAEKWGQEVRAGRSPVYINARSPAIAAKLDPVPVLPRIRTSLTMIVKNEEGNLQACLESVRGLFDEIIVLDTGSTDRTVEIARSFGARVFDFVWVNDFAAARNAALARATGDYAFWLDADDVLEPDQYARLQSLFDHLRPGDEAAYVVRCACDPDQLGGGGQTVVDHVRLFPVREDVRWTYRVHEQILPSLRRAGIPDRWTDIVIRHTGYTNAELRARKLERDEAILLGELEEWAEEPFTLFNLGSIAIERQDWPAALDFLRRSLKASSPTDSITRKLYALIARAHQGLNDVDAALAVCAEGLACDEDDVELIFRKAMLHRQRGGLAEAEQCWRAILRLQRPNKFSSVDMGIYGHLTRRNLAILAELRGDVSEALAQWREVLRECAADTEATAHIGRLSTGNPG
ncbi:MAG: glycosyltransferase [Phycisphaerales bacterium]|nr:glycosyltransferase [Phycisphaerales bacterium]